MRLTGLLREAFASSWASKVPTALVAIVAATMCFIALGTVGKSAANQSHITAQLEAAGARRLTVVDGGKQGFINPRTLREVAAVSSVDRVVAIGSPVDAVNGRIGWGDTRVTVWPLMGRLTDAVTLTQGRWPRTGEALVSVTTQHAMRLASPIGYVITTDNRHLPIVGSYTAQDPFDDLNQGLIVNDDTAATARELRVIIHDIAHVSPTQTAILQILAPADPSSVEIDSPTGLADTAQAVNGQLAGFGRSLLLLILGVGAFFVATVVLADALVRRRDLGRRRTLGASRSDLTNLVVLRTLIPASLGALLGCTIATLTNHHTGYTPPATFTLAIGILALTTAALAAVLPAWFAATRDPVSVMRTP